MCSDHHDISVPSPETMDPPCSNTTGTPRHVRFYEPLNYLDDVTKVHVSEVAGAAMTSKPALDDDVPKRGTAIVCTGKIHMKPLWAS